MMTAPVMNVVVSAERPVSWQPAEMSMTPWAVEVRMFAQSGDALVLDIEVTTSRERTVERWQVVFHGVTAFKQESVGSPGNPPLTRYDWSMRLAAPPTAFWIIDSSEWLPRCRTVQIGRERLTHFVVYETTRHRVWHIAACACTARRVEAGEKLWLSEHALLMDATPVEAGR